MSPILGDRRSLMGKLYLISMKNVWVLMKAGMEEWLQEYCKLRAQFSQHHRSRTSNTLGK